MMAQLKATADKFGLPMGSRTQTFNSRLAPELGLWAQDEGQGHAFHMAAFQAYFVDGRNIAKTEVLLDLVRQCALDPAQAQAVLDQRSYKDAVDADWQASRDQNIMAAPTYIMGEHRLVGAQSHEKLVWLMEQNAAVLR